MAALKGEQVNCRFVHGPIIVGAGPSGLAAAACLHESGVAALVLERSDCIASLWQQRTYDRLKLHLPKEFCELPLMSFPDFYPKYPTKDQFVAYMEAYAGRFRIEPKFKQTVVEARLDQATGLWRVQTQDSLYMSRWLVVATGENAEPVIPEIQGMGDFHGPVLHTSAYRTGSEFLRKKVLVIGCGNSGMEVSLDLCRHDACPFIVVRNSVSPTSNTHRFFFFLISVFKSVPHRILNVVFFRFIFSQGKCGEFRRSPWRWLC